jgi:hypothetical protein
MRRTIAADATRQRLWRAMRILRQFTLYDLLRVVEGATYHNARKFVWNLTRHGYASKVGRFVSGSVGQHQSYRLVAGNDPEFPRVCPRCGNPFFLPCTEKEKEGEKETKKERGAP